MSAKRKTHSASFKAKVALEAYKGDKTAAELISLEGAQRLFEPSQAHGVDETALTAPLYEEIGRLKVELDWLKKKVSQCR